MAGERPAHSKIGASGMYRWAKCPGSVKLAEGIPNIQSIYARQGSAAHEFVGLAMDQAFAENVTTLSVLLKYVEAVKVYSDYIEEIKRKDPGCAVHIEHGFDMSFIFPDLYGTADCVIWHSDIQLLRVIDYKHGEGVPVDVENNVQLLYYALGVITTLGYRPSEIELTIVQPRCYHPAGKIRSWRVPITYFIDFKADLLDAAEATLKPGAKLKAGGHCMFCPAKTNCTEKHNANLSDAKKEFSFYVDPKKDFEIVK